MRISLAVFAAMASFALALPAHAAAWGQKKTPADPTTSGAPYLWVSGTEVGGEQLPLKAVAAEVDVVGVIAHVKVTQIYENHGGQAIEATYVFPGSTRAAVFGMHMTIGEREVKAEIQERGAARRAYDAALGAGKTAGLLEQHRPNVFQMNVGNILPGDRVRVVLDYTELMVAGDDGTFELVYPAVVGPRFNESAADNWTENPHLPAGQASPYDWDLAVRLNAGVPINRIGSPSHDVAVRYPALDQARITLTGADHGDRDFILRYELRGEAIASGLLTYESRDGNYFLMTLQPPASVPVPRTPPREYVFIVDVSGSMRGFPLETTKGLMRQLFATLRPEDRFNIMFFSGGNWLFAPESVPATAANIQDATHAMERTRAGGGTRLLPAMQRVLATTPPTGTSRNIVVVTDGYVTVGTEVFDLIRENLGRANLFTFGIGSSVNRHLIEGMARCGRGAPFVAIHQRDAVRSAARFKRYIEAPALTDIEVSYDGFSVTEQVPSSPPDLFARRPLVIFGRYDKRRGTLRVAGRTGDGRFEKKFELSDHPPRSSNQALRYLWARHRIAELGDYHRLDHRAERAAEITRLGLRHNLLTEFTSFVAIDSEVRTGSGMPARVAQPLPLPRGVPNSATRSYMSSSSMRGLSSGSEEQHVEQAIKSFSAPTLGNASRFRVAISPAIETAAFEIDRNQLAYSLFRLLPSLDACVGRHPAKDGAQLVLEVHFDATGAVSRIDVREAEDVSTSLSDCLRELLANHLEIIFDGSKRAGVITLPLRFRR